MARQDEMQQYVQRVAQAIRAYHSNPGMFTDDEIGQLSNMAAQVGVPFSPQFSTRRAVARSVFELADTALLGLLPDDWAPTAYGSEETVANIAGLLGLAVPIAGGVGAARLAGKGVGAVAKGVGILGKGAQAARVKRAAELAAKAPILGRWAGTRGITAKTLQGIDTALRNAQLLKAAKAIQGSKWGMRAVQWPVGVATTLALDDILGGPGESSGVPTEEELALMQSM